MPTESPHHFEFSLDSNEDGSGAPDSYEGVLALDQDVLASLVIELRTNLQSTQTELTQIKDDLQSTRAELTHTKDVREELTTALAIAQTKISDLKFEKEDMRKSMVNPDNLAKKENSLTRLNQHQAKPTRRQSMFIHRSTECVLSPLGAELEAVRQELKAVRQELVGARIELDEAHAQFKGEREAREASDICVKTLKECE
jgi:chromosome segregation ATPase